MISQSVSTEISFAQYMQESLYGPAGYYASGRAASGRAGDYFTAPDVGPVFGRLLAAQLEAWQESLGYRPFAVIEVGAGQGKLAQSIGAAWAAGHPSARDLFSYTAVEISPARRSCLGELPSRMPCPVQIAATLSELQGKHLRGCIVANELIDAFPVHRLRQHHGRLQEAYVSRRATAGPGELPASIFWRDPSTPLLQAYLDRAGIALPDDYETEINLQMADWLRDASAVLAEGLVLLIDYGRPAHEYYAPGRKRGTLRGFRRHHVQSDVLSAPGTMDLTADVDFTGLALDGLAAGFQPLGFIELGTFLLPSAERLMHSGQWSATDRRATNGLRYLIHPDGMGATFHVLILGKGISSQRVRIAHNRLSRLGLDRPINGREEESC